MSDVVVVGGGIVGLACAYELAKAGASVDLLEYGRTGMQATNAAAGMLAPLIESHGPGPMLDFGLRALRAYPAFAEELSPTGIDVELRIDGILKAAMTPTDIDALRSRLAWQQGRGLTIDFLDAVTCRELEPRLGNRVTGGIFSSDEGGINNQMLSLAVARAAAERAARLHAETPATRFETDGGRITSVLSRDRRFAGDVVVLAAGAWSREIAGIPSAHLPPVRPIKGQMLALRMDPSAPLLRHVVWAPRSYLVPRRDGRLVVGGTVEERGFDDTLTAGGLLALLEGAWRAVPAIEELPIAETWVGFRPGSRDDAPMLGPSGIDGLIVATGHHRNGILLTPITVETVSAYVLTGRLPEIVEPFTPERFSRRHAQSVSTNGQIAAGQVRP